MPYGQALNLGAMQSFQLLYDALNSDYPGMRYLYVYPKAIWNSIADSICAEIKPKMLEKVQHAIDNIHTYLDGFYCLEDDSEEMVEYLYTSRKAIRYQIKFIEHVRDLILHDDKSYQECLDVIKLWSDSMYYTANLKNTWNMWKYCVECNHLDSTNDFNQEALCISTWFTYSERMHAYKAKHTMHTMHKYAYGSWQTGYNGSKGYMPNRVGDAHNYYNIIDLINKHTKQVCEDAQKTARVLDLTEYIETTVHDLTNRVTKDMLVASYMQVQALTKVVGQIVEKLRITGHVLSM
jgi:hypothetical protein